MNSELNRLLASRKRLLIVVHDNPDADAIASAAALKFLAEKRFKGRASIAYGGNIGRAENRAVVDKLRIAMKKINRIKLESYDCVAMVDTQPGAGNNSLPKEKHCHVVIDHHPRRHDLDADFVFIDPDLGATATIFVEWLEESEISIPTNLATALTYAISSETQDLGRETSKRDIQAYLKVFTKASMRKLAQIIHPNLPRSYFITMAKTLQQAKSFRNLITAHLGKITTPDIVAEMADLLLRHERTGWVFCTGRYDDELILSLRTSNPKANAGNFLQRLIGKHLKSALNQVGGHDMTAGGRIPLNGKTTEEITALEAGFARDFARLRGYKDAEWKPLL